MNPFGRAEKKHAEEERRDHECLKNNKQKRINAAAAPDAVKVSTMALPLPTAPVPIAIGTEKNVNGDFVLGPKLINSSVSIGKNTAGFKAGKEV